MLRFATSVLVAAHFLLAASSSHAQEVTLRAITAFAEGTWGSKNFERFIEKVNKEGKGSIQVNYIGGPRAMPPFEVGNAVRTGVVDLANDPFSTVGNCTRITKNDGFVDHSALYQSGDVPIAQRNFNVSLPARSRLPWRA